MITPLGYKGITPLGRAVGGAAPFDPATISGLKLWLKADAGLYQDSGRATPATADNDPVWSWADQSGQGRHATAEISGRRPLLKTAIQNGMPVVRFDGTDDDLRFTTVDLPAFSMYIVFKVNNTGGNYGGPISWAASGQNGFIIAAETSSAVNWQPHLIIYNGSSETANKKGPSAYTVPYGFVLHSWRSTPDFYVNGASQSISNSGGGYNNYIGSVGVGYSAIGADIGEIIVMDSVADSTIHANIAAYLNTRWALY